MIFGVRIFMVGVLLGGVVLTGNAMDCNHSEGPNKLHAGGNKTNTRKRFREAFRRTPDELQNKALEIGHRVYNFKKACSTPLGKVPGLGTPGVRQEALDKAREEIKQIALDAINKAKETINCDITQKINEKLDSLLADDFKAPSEAVNFVKNTCFLIEVGHYVDSFKGKCGCVLRNVSWIGLQKVKIETLASTYIEKIQSKQYAPEDTANAIAKIETTMNDFFNKIDADEVFAKLSLDLSGKD